ncbi:MAG: hypothetical protein WBG08_01365 [Litorimonas sp.]
MSHRSIRITSALALLGAVFFSSHVSDAAFASQRLLPTAQVEAADDLVVDLKAGQVLEMALPKARMGREGREARNRYTRLVVPLMEAQPFEVLGALEVEETVIGQGRPSFVEFRAYRDKSVKSRLEATPEWRELLDYRGKGWRRQDVFSTVLSDDLVLRFDPSKHYTLAVAWTDPARPEDYDRYLAGVETEFAKIGARFLQRFDSVAYRTQDSGREVPPSRIIWVEWDDEDGLDRLLGSEAYSEHAPLFRSGVSDFRFYRIASPSRS